MMKRRIFIIGIVSILLLTYHSSGFAAKRALVIGNSDYEYAPLRNPINDARAMADTLEQSGFSVMKLTNATQKKMEDAIREFGRRVEFNDVALFYFSGHGVQMDGINFLIPVGADILAADKMKYKAVAANMVLDKLEDAGSRINLIILDACRSNPFKGFRSLRMGLTTMSAARGTLIAYSTSPDDVALDGDGENSPYTANLLKAMSVPGLTVEQVFKTVRVAVMEETDDQQVPWESSSLTGDFYFSAIPAPTPTPVVIPTAIPLPTATPISFESQLLEKARRYRENRQYALAFELYKELLRGNPGDAEGKAGLYELLRSCKTAGDAAYQQQDSQTMQEQYRLYLLVARYVIDMFGDAEIQTILQTVTDRMAPAPTATPAPSATPKPAPTPTATPHVTILSTPVFRIDALLVRNAKGKNLTPNNGNYRVRPAERIEVTVRVTITPERNIGVSWTTRSGKLPATSRLINTYTAPGKGGDYITVYIWDTDTGEEISETISIYVE